jgi:hypothetical protein
MPHLVDSAAQAMPYFNLQYFFFFPRELKEKLERKENEGLR